MGLFLPANLNGPQRFGKEASTDFVSGGPFKMGISFFYFFDRTSKSGSRMQTLMALVTCPISLQVFQP